MTFGNSRAAPGGEVRAEPSGRSGFEKGVEEVFYTGGAILLRARFQSKFDVLLLPPLGGLAESDPSLVRLSRLPACRR